MALIKCPECAVEVSDKAPACPKCAFPIKATTIEQTGKSYKAGVLVGSLTFIVGICCIIGGDDSGFGLLAMLFGAAIFIGSRFFAWWDHG